MKNEKNSHKRICVVLMLVLTLIMSSIAIGGCQEQATVTTTTASQGATTTKAGQTTTATTAAPVDPYAENVSLTLVHGNVHFGGVDLVEDDTIVAYFENLFNMDLTIIRSSDWTGTINMMVASGEVPDIMHQAADLSNQLYKDLREGDVLADFIQVAEENPGRYMKLLEVTEDKWAKAIFSEDDGASFYVLPREYGLYPHAFYIREDWLEKVGLQKPTNLDELYTTLQKLVAADPDGKGTTGISCPIWGLNHIVAGFNGVGLEGRWTVQDGKYIRVVIADDTRDGLRYLNKLYTEKLLDQETFTGTQDIFIGKFVNGEAAMLILDFTFASSLEKSLLELYPTAKLGVLAPDLQGPKNIARYAASKWFQSVAVSNRSADVARCYDILEFILSDDGQDILANGIEGVHYTLGADGTMFKNIKLFEHEMWNLEGYETMHRLRAPITLKQIYNPDYYNNKDLVSDFFGVLNTLEDKVGVDALMGKRLDTPTEVGSLPNDIANTWIANFIMGEKSLDTDWDQYVAEYYASGYDRIEQEANEKYKP